MTFDGSQKIIGKGAQAEVLLYHGFAYKVYNQSYPAEWIAFEKEQQQAVNKAGLCPVKYYDTDDTHIIKMDLVEGEQLEKAVPKAPEEGFKLLAKAFRFVHEADAGDTTIPPLSETAGLMLSEDEKSEVLPVIARLSQKYKSCICQHPGRSRMENRESRGSPQGNVHARVPRLRFGPDAYRQAGMEGCW